MYSLAIFLYWIFVKIFYRHKIYGKSKWKSVKGLGGIVAANHTSFLDPPLVGISAYPEKIHFLGKEALFKHSFFAWILHQLNTHPVAKGSGNLSTIKLACELIGKGQKVVIFPEGGRSSDGQLQKAQTGVGMLVLKNRCIVIPVYLHGIYEVWPANRKLPKLKGRTACIVGSPLQFNFDEITDKKHMQIHISNAVMEAIADLKAWYLNGAIGTPP